MTKNVTKEIVYLDVLRRRIYEVHQEANRIWAIRGIQFCDDADDKIKEAILLLLKAERAVDLAHGSERHKE